MGFPKSTEQNESRKRKRTSSNISGNSNSNSNTDSTNTNNSDCTSNKKPTIIIRQDISESQDGSKIHQCVLTPDFIFEESNSPKNSAEKNDPSKNYTAFLNKARAQLRATRDKHRKKKLPRREGALLEAIDQVLSPRDDYGKMFTTTIKSLGWLMQLPGYDDLYKEVILNDMLAKQQVDVAAAAVHDDDDNRPSTSRAAAKENAKINTENLTTSQSPSSSKRKRRASVTMTTTTTTKAVDEDPDIGYEPPLAKRQQRVPSIYQSQPNSVASSIYPSPLDELLEQEIETGSTSSTVDSANAIDEDVATNNAAEGGAAVVIPDSPNSLQNSDADDADDDDDEDEVSSSTTDDSSDSSDLGSEHVCPHIICPEGCGANDREDGIVSHKNSPFPAHAKFRRNSIVTTKETETTEKVKEADDAIKTTTKTTGLDDVNAFYNCMTPAAEADPPRQCPLPALSWANAPDVWQTMCKKDEEVTCLRDAGMLDRHPGLQPRMRAILLDWLIEVCEVYKLHRETYYLAVDYLDRYLTAKYKVQKTHLQLIGITCLFVAAKVEEIYPPKIGEFAYVTDGACQESDILNNEILLLQELDWDINPVTPIGWLGIYMQLNVNNRTPKTLATNQKSDKLKLKENNNPNTNGNGSGVDEIDQGFIYPQFSGFEFVQTAQLLDLCSLDVGVAHFPYSVLAAAAISHTFNRETALRCSGLDWKTIQPCARWMEPFFVVISTEADNLYMMEQNEQVQSKFGLGHICANITTDDSHIIQTHTITMQMFDRVTQMQEQLLSPANLRVRPEGLLTPPASSRKPLDNLDEEHTKTNCKSTITQVTTLPLVATTTTTKSKAATNQSQQKFVHIHVDGNTTIAVINQKTT